MTDIVWQDPENAKVKPRASKHDELVTALRRRPGRWAVFGSDCANSTVSSIHRGKIAAFRPAGDFQAASVSIGGNRCKVWVRYVGTKANRSAHLAEVRAWATAAGWAVPTRGRIPQQILDAYDQAHQES